VVEEGWRTSDMHNWVPSGRQRHVDPVHSKSRKEQREAGERRVALPAGWRRNPVSRADTEVGKSRRLRSGRLGGIRRDRVQAPGEINLLA
jgi:hypothetical protein